MDIIEIKQEISVDLPDDKFCENLPHYESSSTVIVKSQISDKSYENTSQTYKTNNTALERTKDLTESIFDNILLQCQNCNRISKHETIQDHNYSKRRNYLKIALEDELAKDLEDQIYKCKFCQEILNNSYNYLLHLQTHTSEFISCQFCDRKLNLMKSLNEHMFFLLRYCEICRKIFQSEKDMRKHIKSNCHRRIMKEKKLKLNDKNTFNNPTIKIVSMKLENSTSKTVALDLKDVNLKSLDIEKDDDKIIGETSFANNNKSDNSSILLTENSNPNSSGDISKKINYLYECAGCARTFINKKTVIEHINTHHPESYKRWQSLYKQKEVMSGKFSRAQEEYTCKYCLISFTVIAEYLKHVKDNHFCTNCNLIFNSHENLSSHECKFLKSIKCQICSKPFHSQENYQLHLKTHENYCEVCFVKFVTDSLLSVHKKNFHPEGICRFCQMWFPSKFMLNEHKKLEHRIDGEYFNCWICNEKNFLSNDFRIHMLEHGERRPFSCNNCDRSYAHYTTMMAHKGDCQFFDSSEIIECNLCKKAFYGYKKYHEHKNEHAKLVKIDKLQKESGVRVLWSSEIGENSMSIDRSMKIVSHDPGKLIVKNKVHEVSVEGEIDRRIINNNKSRNREINSDSKLSEMKNSELLIEERLKEEIQEDNEMKPIENICVLRYTEDNSETLSMEVVSTDVELDPLNLERIDESDPLAL